MNDDAFARLVAEEVKNKTSRSQRNILMQKENWARWERALVALVQNLQAQLDNIEEDKSADVEKYSSMGSAGKSLLARCVADYDARKSKIERFKFHVEARLDDVSRMIATDTPIENDEVANAKLYFNAINKHKELIEEYDLEPTPIDYALWAAIEGHWKFNTIKPEDMQSE